MATTAGTNEALVKSTCNLPALADSVISPHLATAEARAKAHIGDTIYAAIVAATSPYGAADLTALKRAEALLCGAIAVPLSNYATEGRGVFSALSSPGDGDVIGMVSDSRASAIAGRLSGLAYEALEPYWREYRFAQRESDDEVDGLPDPQALDLGRSILRASS